MSVCKRGFQADTNVVELPGERAAEQWPTVLRRSGGSTRVLNLEGLSNCVIDGITIRDGCITDRNGAGLYLSNSSLVLSNCLVASNQSVRYNCDGGGVYVTGNRSRTMADAVISGNVANCGHPSYPGRSGGGIYIAAGSWAEISRAVVASNWAGRSGNASANSPGGGVHNEGILLLRNCLVVSNRVSNSQSGDGIYSAGTTVVESCTLIDNFGVGIRYAGGAMGITNAIVWGTIPVISTIFPWTILDA